MFTFEGNSWSIKTTTSHIHGSQRMNLNLPIVFFNNMNLEKKCVREYKHVPHITILKWDEQAVIIREVTDWRRCSVWKLKYYCQIFEKLIVECSSSTLVQFGGTLCITELTELLSSAQVTYNSLSVYFNQLNFFKWSWAIPIIRLLMTS